MEDIIKTGFFKTFCSWSILLPYMLNIKIVEEGMVPNVLGLDIWSGRKTIKTQNTKRIHNIFTFIPYIKYTKRLKNRHQAFYTMIRNQLREWFFLTLHCNSSNDDTWTHFITDEFQRKFVFFPPLMLFVWWWWLRGPWVSTLSGRNTRKFFLILLFISFSH